MIQRQIYWVSSAGVDLLEVKAFTPEGACNIAAIKLGIPVSNLKAQVAEPPPATAPIIPGPGNPNPWKNNPYKTKP